MAWGNSCHRLPRIGGYIEAEAFFNGASPSRSNTWGADERSLSQRPDHNKRIVRWMHATGAYVYKLMLYNTPLATYLPNGGIHIMCHDTNMSRAFLDAVLPAGLSTLGHNKTTMIRAKTPEGPAWYLGGFGTLEFAPCGPGYWRLNTTPVARVRQQLCPKRAAQIRKVAKPFLAWVAVTRALCGDTELPPWQPYPERYPKTLEQLQDTELWPDLAPYVGDRDEWIQGAYDAFDARTEYLISDYEPPKRGRSQKYS